MAGLDLSSKRRNRRRRQADSGFFDSNCSNDIPSPDSEQRPALRAKQENSKVSVFLLKLSVRFCMRWENLVNLFSL